MTTACGRKKLVPLLPLANIRWAGVDGDDGVHARGGELAQRIFKIVMLGVVPRVLANQKPNALPSQRYDRCLLWTRLEMAALVEHVVRRQQLLVVVQDRPALLEHDQAVAQTLARTRIARNQAGHDRSSMRLGGFSESSHCPVLQLQEPRLVQQILRIVARERELAEYDQVGVAVLLEHLELLREIAVEIADLVVELCSDDGKWLRVHVVAPCVSSPTAGRTPEKDMTRRSRRWPSSYPGCRTASPPAGR